MKSARFYICVNCNQQVNICSDCDHGNIYCTKRCALLARKRRRKLVFQRYQSTKKGKQCNAARQYRYRARIREQKNIVTHRGSQILFAHVLLLTMKGELTHLDTHVGVDVVYCCICGNRCSIFLRLGFLRRTPTNKKRSLWPQAP